MKGPNFNARLTKMNQATDVWLARLAASLKQAGVSNLKLRAFKEVLRPFLHLLNFSQEENDDPNKMLEVCNDLATAMLLEVARRQLPRGTPHVIVQQYLQQQVNEMTEVMISAFEAEYGMKTDVKYGDHTPVDPTDPPTMQ